MKETHQLKVCMIDAGMDISLIETCLNYFRTGEVGCGRKKLQRYRTYLLKEIQIKNKQLNCLDYLLGSDFIKIKNSEEEDS